MPRDNKRLNQLNTPVSYLAPSGYRPPPDPPAYPWLKEFLGWVFVALLVYINLVIYMGGF